MTAESALCLSSVHKVFGSFRALQQVSLKVNSGESVALVGPNGAGKSTLFKIGLGLLPSTSGKVEVLGHSPEGTRFQSVKRRLGFLPEQVLFQGALTGAETLGFYASLKGADPRHNDEILKRVQLREVADRRVSTYSKGMRQRLGLAQALLGAPELLFLDEPTSGLDPEARQNFFSILEEEKARGAAIVLSSHVLTELEARTDQVAILSRGALKAIGRVSELKAGLDLKTRFRLRVTPDQKTDLLAHFQGQDEIRCEGKDIVLLSCHPSAKKDLLGALMGLGSGFEDIDIIEPSLEQIFTRHTAGESLS